MKTAANRLDDQELLHLALRASNENRHEDSINYLKQAIELAPNNAKAHYMLGAEHAEIGLYDRAAEEMAKAVELDPNLVTACFQLGLLHITSARVAEAEEAWKPLDKLGEKNALYQFKKGMLHLARDEFSESIAALEKGISLNSFNEALNRDMQRVLGEVQNRVAANSADKAEPAPKEQPKKPGSHVLLSAYRQNREETDKD